MEELKKSLQKHSDKVFSDATKEAIQTLEKMEQKPLCNMCKKREGINKSNIDMWYCQPCTDSLDSFGNDDLVHHLENEIERYKRVLRFYANKKNYEVDVINQWEPVRPVLKDNGEKARHVLDKPYSQKDYEKAKEQNLDLDNWNDYVTYYELGER